MAVACAGQEKGRDRMNIVSMLVLTALMVLAAVYAQTHIARYTAGAHKVRVARAVLIVVGCALGYVSARLYGSDSFTAGLAFLSGFGAVHVPAAFILLIKAGRGAGQT